MMVTETQIVKEFVALLNRHPEKFSGALSRYLRHAIHLALTRDDLRGMFSFGGTRPDRQYMAERLEHRIRKKVGQPFRRKKRGPLRRRAAGKTEVTRKRPV
jgi:hypothetical protein